MIFFLAGVIRKYENLIKETAENGKEWDERTITEVEGNREKRDEMAILRIALTSRKVSLTVNYLRYVLHDIDGLCQTDRTSSVARYATVRA